MILTLKELAEYLRVNERTILRMLKNGQIQGVKIGGQWRFNGTEIDRMFFSEPEKEHGESVGLDDLLHHHLSIPVSRLLRPERMLLNMNAETVEQVASELIVPFVREGLVLDAQDLRQRILAREKLLSTGIGNGVAVPHPRDPIPTLREPAVVVVGRSEAGIDYGAVDGKPVHMFFLCVCQNIELHLYVMGQIARLLRDGNFMTHCVGCDNPEDFLRVVLDSERRHFFDAE